MHAHVLAHTQRLLALRGAHVAAQPRARARVRCEEAGRDCLWLLQPSALGGSVLTVVDFSGNAARELTLPAGLVGARIHLLHATSPAPDSTVVHGVQGDGDRLLFDAARVPFGAVLHLPETTS